MANVRQLKDHGAPIFPITHVSLVKGMEYRALMDATYAWDGTGAPDVSKIPAGVVVTYNGTDYTGTLVASASTTGRFYLVPSTTVQGEWDRYMTDGSGSSYAWKAAGNTSIPSPAVVDNETTDDPTKPHSAAGGKRLKDQLGELEAEVGGNFTKDITWSNGYIDPAGLIKNSSQSRFSQPFLLKTGQSVTVGTRNTNICIIGTTVADTLAVGDTVNVIQKTSAVNQFETYEYTATEDIKIVICVLWAEYSVSFYDKDNLGEKIENLKLLLGGISSEITISERINGKYISDTGTTSTLSAKSISEPWDVVEGDVLIGKITDVQSWITALAFYTGSDNRNFIPILNGSQTESGFVYTVTKTGKIVTCYDNSHIPTITHLKSANIRSLRGNVESNKEVLDALCKILGYGKTVSTPADDVTGKYISSTGVLTTYSGYVIKEAVPVKKGDYVIVDRVHAANIVAVAAIEVDGTYYPNAIGNGSNSVGKYAFIADRDGDLYVSYLTPYSSDYFGSPVTVTVYSADIVSGTPTPPPTPSVEGFEELQVLNLFDKSTVTKGKYINTDGTLSDDSRYSVSDYIPVEFGKKYTYPTYYSLYGGNVGILNCYNENKERIGYVTGTADADYIVTTEITLANTAYVRVTVLDTTVSTPKNLFNHIGVFMFVNAETLPDKYIPYGETAMVVDSATVNISDGNEFNPLRGKTAIFIGDSICNAGTGGDTQDGWAGRIGMKNQMMFANKGVGGATFTKNTGWGTTCIAEMDLLGGPDYIIFEGGTNDADRIGSILNGNTPALFGTYDNKTYNTTFDQETFCGAVEYLIKRILDNYPSSKVGYIVAPKMGATNNGYGKDDNNRRAYFETVMDICKKWGVPFINLWDENPMNPSLASFYNNGDDSFYTDGQHLTSIGYDRISEQIGAWMKTL